MIILTALILLLSAKPIQAVSQNITATVRLSVCGDLAAEGDEECDNNDLNGATCRSQGYFGGNLTCDIACDFDESACFGVAPSPSPSPSPSTSPTPSPSPSSSSNTNQNQPSPSPSPQLLVIPTSEITQEVVRAVPLLPTPIARFDRNQDGQITRDELRPVVTDWVGQWVNYLSVVTINQEPVRELETCDVNLDQVCDLVDLSVLLYHVI